MDQVSKNAISIIAAIQHYRETHGNTDLIDRYYEEHGTYTGLVDYLKEIEDQENRAEK